MTNLNCQLQFDNLLETKDLLYLVEKSRNSTSKCNSDNKTSVHEQCFTLDSDKSLWIPQCPSALMFTLINIIATKPNLFEDDMKKAVVSYYQRHLIKLNGLLNMKYLEIMHNKSKTPALSWLKFESLLTHLIKEKIYEPRTVADELLTFVKADIPEHIASKLASVMEACAKFCRDANKHAMEEEEKEKWCEIIDWLSWFIGSSEF